MAPGLGRCRIFSTRTPTNTSRSTIRPVRIPGTMAEEEESEAAFVVPV